MSTFGEAFGSGERHYTEQAQQHTTLNPPPGGTNNPGEGVPGQAPRQPHRPAEGNVAARKPVPGTPEHDAWVELRSGRPDPESFDSAIRPDVERLVDTWASGDHASAWAQADAIVRKAERLKASGSNTSGPSEPASSLHYAQDGTVFLSAEDAAEHNSTQEIIRNIRNNY